MFTDNTSELLDYCKLLVDNSDNVKLNLQHLEKFDKLFENEPKPVSWDWYFSDSVQSITDVIGELFTVCGLNGGYFYDTDPVTQWNLDGSGSRALDAWISTLHARGLHPYYVLDKDHAVNELKPELFNQPMPGARLDIIRELMEKSEWVAQEMTEWFKDGYHFRWRHVQELALMMPNSFGSDPFLKKACLVFLILSGYLSSRGHLVRNNLPIPSDYQIPRIFAYEGVIELSDEFFEILKSERMINVTAPYVQDFRAAAILAARELGRRHNIDDYLVDNMLFTTYRKDQKFIADSLPAMRCNSIWF